MTQVAMLAGGPLVNAQNYGAIGNSVHDDTSALTAAAAAARARGWPLYLPRTSGSYVLTDIWTAQDGDYWWSNGATLDVRTDHTATGKYLGIGVLGGAAAQDVTVWGLRLECSNAQARNQAYGMLSIFGGQDITVYVQVLSGEGCGVWSGTPGPTVTTGVHRLWLRARVTGTLADGIHLSRGIRDSQVWYDIDSTGDDGVALNSCITDDGVHNYDQIEGVHIDGFVRDITAVVGSGVSLNGCRQCEARGRASNINSPGSNSFGLNVGTSAGGNGAATYTAANNELIGFIASACKNGILVGVATDTIVDSCQGLNSVDVSPYGLGIISATNTLVNGGKYSGNVYGAYGHLGSGNRIGGGPDLRGNSTGALLLDAGTIADTSCVIG